MNPDIHMLITKSARELADGMDELVLAFFGSEEQARIYGHMFVVEQLPTKFVTLQSPDAMGISYYAETEIRIRPKTKAELESDNRV